jgi:DNA polymerase I
MRLIADLESNGLLDTVTRIHCVVTKDADTGAVRRFRSTDGSLEAGLTHLEAADEIIGHNFLSYDLRALKKVYPAFSPKAKIFDTLVCSRVIWTDIYDRDCRARLNPKLRGRHSLESWGFRLGLRKGNFGKAGSAEENEKAWEHWSVEMEDYCAQDVEVTEKLWRTVLKKNYSPTCLEIEHRFREIIDMQEAHGFRFDVEKAERLMVELQKSRYALEQKLQAVFPPRIETMKTPQYWYFSASVSETVQAETKSKLEAKLRGLGLKHNDYKDRLCPGPLKTKEHLFNPGSRQQVAERLGEKYGWKPTEFTDSGEPKVSETILEALPWPEAAQLCDYYVVQKTLGMLADGDNGCLRLIRDGRIHGSVNTGGAVTGRCTHSKPNIAQTPSVIVRKVDGKKTVMRGLEGRYGYDFRALYVPEPGHVLVGWDASGLELRCLAHYMAAYDGGAYGKILLEGDIHTTNQEAAGLYLRDSAKTFILIQDDSGESPRLKLGELRETPTADNPEPSL